jgi:hypothetical protein
MGHAVHPVRKGLRDQGLKKSHGASNPQINRPRSQQLSSLSSAVMIEDHFPRKPSEITSGWGLEFAGHDLDSSRQLYNNPSATSLHLE